jgi:hypothetical protein
MAMYLGPNKMLVAAGIMANTPLIQMNKVQTQITYKDLSEAPSKRLRWGNVIRTRDHKTSIMLSGILKDKRSTSAPHTIRPPQLNNEEIVTTADRKRSSDI